MAGYSGTPLPRKLGQILKNFRHVLMPEMNLGQLRLLVRGEYLIDAKGLNKVRGQPFTIHEIVDGVRDLLAGKAEGDEVPLRASDALDANIAGTPGGG